MVAVPKNEAGGIRQARARTCRIAMGGTTKTAKNQLMSACLRSGQAFPEQ